MDIRERSISSNAKHLDVGDACQGNRSCSDSFVAIAMAQKIRIGMHSWRLDRLYLGLNSDSSVQKCPISQFARLVGAATGSEVYSPTRTFGSKSNPNLGFNWT